MSASENQEQKDKKSPISIIFVIVAILVLILAIGLINNNKTKTEKSHETALVSNDAESDVQDIAESVTAQPESTEETVADAPEADETADAPSEAPLSAEQADFDLEKASTPRILGDVNAPVKISEHSSFTCGACAHYHETNLNNIKKDYIETGKAYIVYDDFPRNQNDVYIGAIARCVPEAAYFDFIQLLFETQKDWMTEGYLDHIKQNAKLTGASDEQIETCLQSKELQETLAKRQQDAYDTYNITGTPTLVINDKEVISGLAEYEEIKALLDKEYEEKSKH